MNSVRYIKSFSKGQITIPKELRIALGILDNFWLKLYLQDGKIIAEPVEKQSSKADYKKTLLSIKHVWNLEPEVKKNREQIEKQLAKRAL